MNTITRFLLLIVVAVAVVYLWQSLQRVPAQQTVSLQETSTSYTSEKGVTLTVTSPILGATVTSPLTVKGEVPGSWYFEASFPMVIVNWDGLIIGEGYATAQAQWMTPEMVPFVGTVNFDAGSSLIEGRQAVVGTLILQRDNPSGLPENDDAAEIPIRF